MFFFKAVNEKKSPKAHCYIDQSKRPEWFSPSASKQKLHSRAHIKMFFLPVLLCPFLMPGYTAANVDGDYDIGGHGGFNISTGDSDFSGIAGLGNGTLVISELFGRNETTPYNKPVNIKFSCSDVKSKSSRKICEAFREGNEDKYQVRYLYEGKFIEARPIKTTDSIDFIREHESNTIYILPKANIWFEDIIKISGSNIAIIGDADDDGNYPTLKGSKKKGTMMKWENCQNCMLANINIDPTTENAHSLPISVSGENSEIEFKNISATHSDTGLLVTTSARSITLDNVKATYEPGTRHTQPAIFSDSVISLYNCARIKAKNVVLHDIILNSDAVYPSVIKVRNPVDINFEDIYIGLAEGSFMSRDMAYINLAFDNMAEYAQPGGFTVKGVMKGLHFGVYTGGKTREYVTVPDYWPTNRHVLSLSKHVLQKAMHPADTTKVTGHIVIQSNDNLQAIANKPGVDTVAGDDLFYNLKVSFPGLISPTLNSSTPSATFTPNSSSIYNLTSAPQPLRQTDDDSGYNQWEKLGIGLGVVVGVAVIVAAGVVGYRNRAMLAGLIGGSSRALTSMHYQKNLGDEEALAADDDLNENPFGQVYSSTVTN